MKSTRYKATAALGLATTGFLASYPFSAGFYGGMLNSGCWAAMVGGLADWFAVTALFRKPLGFSYRTAIIPRNRERIFNDLIAFVEQDLLTKDNILNTLSHYNVAELLIRFLEEHQGKQGAKEIAHKVTQDVLALLDANEFGRVIEDMAKEHASRVQLFPAMVQTLEWTVKNGYEEKVIDFLLDEFTRIVEQAETRRVLEGLFIQVKETYRQGTQSHKLAAWLLDMSAEHFVGAAQTRIAAFLQSLKEPGHPLRGKLKTWIDDMIAQLKDNSTFREKVEDWKAEVIRTKLSIRYQVGHYLRYLRQTAAEPGDDKIPENLDKAIDGWVDKFKADAGQQAAFDAWVKNKLEAAVDKYHDQVSIIVKERLAELTDELLVEFIEGKVGDDLQMIRINGSLVGGLVGVLLYVFTYWLERLW